jgi:quinolinate synthase
MTRFPSLLVTADELRPQGAFAEAQAQYLLPDQKQVWEEVGQGGVEELSSR